MHFDTIGNQWNQWVLGYDAERQFAFLIRLGMESITWQKIALNMVVGLGVMIALQVMPVFLQLIRTMDALGGGN